MAPVPARHSSSRPGDMMTVSLDQLRHPTELRAFIQATADITGTSVSMVLKITVEVLERQLCVRSDDIDEVWRLGRLLQVVRVESHSAPHASCRN